MKAGKPRVYSRAVAFTVLLIAITIVFSSAVVVNNLQTIVAQDNTGENDNEFICSKLFETCNLPPSNDNEQQKESQNNASSDDDEDEQAISEKYLEGGGSEPPVNSVNNDSDQDDIQIQVNPPEPPQDYETFENSALGVKLMHPVGWQIVTTNNSDAREQTLMSPLESAGDSYREAVKIRVTDLTEPVTLEEYTNKTLDSMRKLSFLNIVDSGPTTLSDNSAYRTIGVRTGNQTINVIDEWTVKDTTIYRLTFSLEEAKSDLYFPIALAMHDSFEITK